jgi:hypothetical protein
MSSDNNNINFSLEYVISIIVILVVCNALIKSNPQMNTLIVLLFGLVVGFVSLFIMNKVFPKINKFGSNIYQYYTYQFMNGFSGMGYVHVWPPILAILIIFIILLYNRQLG